MSPFKLILVIIIALLVVVLGLKNRELVEVSFYDFSLDSHNIQVPLILVMIGSMAFGFSIAWFSGWVSRLKFKALLHRKDKTIEELQSQLIEYKPKPTASNPSGTTPPVE
ncbi:MAG: LapA family protein [Candidatus Nitronauta litoralis]|uniref:LapA family protein n=1 Tax=Candidatus Nitronauta litoralis TaxID=2705533 RepID=A0A7T0G174_9BACT|nr:MAG: LapA family protein [Candidatus Nitronauta litoralis]